MEGLEAAKDSIEGATLNNESSPLQFKEIQLFVFIVRVPNKTSSVQCRDGAGFPMNFVFDFNVHT